MSQSLSPLAIGVAVILAYAPIRIARNIRTVLQQQAVYSLESGNRWEEYCLSKARLSNSKRTVALSSALQKFAASQVGCLSLTRSCLSPREYSHAFILQLFFVASTIAVPCSVLAYTVLFQWQVSVCESRDFVSFSEGRMVRRSIRMHSATRHSIHCSPHLHSSLSPSHEEVRLKHY